MKTLSRFKGMLFLAIVTATACTDQKQTPSEILGNQENREAIMAEISNDPGMMTEMMAQMTQNNHAMQMMEGNKDMMGKMMGNHQRRMQKDTVMAAQMMTTMLTMVEKDSTLCKMMCAKMAGNKHMMGMRYGMMKDTTMACPMHKKEQR